MELTSDNSSFGSKSNLHLFSSTCFHKDYNVWGPHFHPFTLSNFYFLMELDVDKLSNE